MQRFRQIVFVVSLLALSWLAMMAVHELGHVVGAVITGGRVEQVVLHPLTISRTDVSPNPHPLAVVWLGPVLGCVLPVLAGLLIPPRYAVTRRIALFFAGFCLLANGAYIAFGAFDGVGDCGIMLQHGAPLWTLLLFGAIAIAAGFHVWHRLGSVRQFFAEPQAVKPVVAYTLAAMLAVLIVVEFTISAN